MSKKACLNIGLLSHYFTDNNLGCVALSICNLLLIDKAAETKGIPVRYIVYVNEKQPHWNIAQYTKNDFEYRIFSSSKKTLRHPLALLRTKIFDGCDIIFNLCAGDGFTDIYGFGRVLSETYMTVLAGRKGMRLVFSPQTIGPFDGHISRMIAKRALNYVEHIYTRDGRSALFCRELGYKGSIEEVIDVAFALPYEPRTSSRVANKINVGLNVSGLLYAGGYDHNNYFGLSFDYKQYVHRLVEELLKSGYAVHLISHVITPDGSIEDDYVACQNLMKEYPNAVLMPRSESPIEVKSYIAGLDAFIGARMHSTIAAVSAEVPVIPIAYSRKFNGLYDTLGYPYYIDARSGIDLEKALHVTLEYLTRRSDLYDAVTHCKDVYNSRLNEFICSLGNILSENAGV